MKVVTWYTLIFYMNIIIVKCVVDISDFSLESWASKLDFANVDMNKFFNRSISTLSTGLNKKQNIIFNDLTWGSFYDFTSNIRDFSCSPFICEQNVLYAHCEFNSITRMPKCSNCTTINNEHFCLFNNHDSTKMFSQLVEFYDKLVALVEEKDYHISNNSDLLHMLSIIKYTVPFYYFSFTDNFNPYYEPIAYINNFLFNRTVYSKLNFTNETFLSETTKFINDILSYSVFSLGFNYAKFIQVFVPKTDYSKTTLWTQYGRNTSLVQPFGIQEILLGNLTKISEIKQHKQFSSDINYYTYGLPDLNNLISITLPHNMNYDIFIQWYPRIVNNEWHFSLKYIVSYIINNNAYYTSAGIKPVTPIITIGLTDYINDYAEYTAPSKKSYSIKIISPWLFEKMIFSIGDVISNCNVVQWSHAAQYWLPSLHSHIDKDSVATTETQITFYVNSLGTYGIDCDYYIQRNNIP